MTHTLLLVDRGLGEASLGRRDRESERRPLPRVLAPDLGGRDVESLARDGQQRPHDLPAVLEGVRSRDADLHLVGDRVHGRHGIAVER